MKESIATRWMCTALLLLAGACYPTAGGDEPTAAQWNLVADTSLALIDADCSSGGDCVGHRNPLSCDSMRMKVTSFGRLCGTCARGGIEEEVCGGFITGLPYQCNMQIVGGQSCVRCVDMYGRARVDRCGAAPAGDQEFSSGASVCRELYQRDGQSCEVCIDAYGQVVSEECAGGGSPGAAATGGTISDASSCPSPSVSRMEGQMAFTRALNEILGEAGLPAHEPVPYTPLTDSDPTGREEVDPFIGMDVEAWCGSEWDPAQNNDIITDGTWYREGRPRCDRMVHTAMQRIATQTTVCSRGDACESHFTEGLMHEVVTAHGELTSAFDCIGSPIVLDMNDNGISTTNDGARFDLAGIGLAAPTAWIERGDALLARDLNGDGRISKGVELFGEVSATGPVSDGFEALARLDDNGDGVITAEDAAFGELLLWADDGDGQSRPSELIPLEAASIERLELNAIRADTTDDHGSVLSLWSSYARGDGSSAAMCDVFFAQGRSLDRTGHTLPRTLLP